MYEIGYKYNLTIFKRNYWEMKETLALTQKKRTRVFLNEEIDFYQIMIERRQHIINERKQ